MISPAWFLGLYLLMAASQPAFDHTYHPVSMLGALGGFKAIVWNVLGFILPGAVIAVFGWSIRRTFCYTWTGYAAGMALAISGFLMAMAGVFRADLDQANSLTQTLHVMSGWGSLAAFLVAGVLTPWILWSRLGQWWAPVRLLALVFGTFAYQVLGVDQWWLGQRIGLACYFLWVALTARLMRRTDVVGVVRRSTNRMTKGARPLIPARS
jgi:hypothetical membrane protein